MLMVLVAILILVVIVVVYLALPGGKLYRQYANDVHRSFQAAVKPQSELLFTDEAIAGLPVPMRRYLSRCGYVGKPMMDHMYADFRAADFALSQGQNPVKIHYEQHNFVARPDRHAYLDAKMFGIPLNGKDTLLGGVGSMTIVLAKSLTLAQSTGDDMSQSQLITTLADGVLMPSLYLQDYVAWTPIDETHAECAIAWGGLSASGTFTFNEMGEIIRFDTNDRYMDDNGKNMNLPWTVEYGNYREVDGFRRPGTVRIYWHMPDGSEYTYFECADFVVSYDHLGRPDVPTGE